MPRYFPGEPEVQFGRTTRHEDIEYAAGGMDYAGQSSSGIEAASVEEKAIDAEKDVATIVMTRPVAERV